MNLVISQAETHTWQCPSLQRSYSSKVLLNVRNTVFVPHCLSVASIHGTTHQVIQCWSAGTFTRWIWAQSQESA